ncbi:sugar ABC transporter substrate-binding protein [Cellulomonas sp. ACRRI]|uniref:ABC transporter substrate-binding protein n=1 Tax=Cellulomonas sp. ACRRI TaxID=2918188 RepID=UPI001EF1751A|nr:sugar ABC transporter substrate-binding protein [Cellulomonas sp. ACRRI]MCG7288136.1 sugar ABC transporter substrate-binding protein [Cellulomonas sp. ACRRI]
MRHRLPTAVAALALVLPLAACGGDADAEDGPPTFTVATWANETEADELDAILDGLNDAQDTYRLEQMVIPGGEYYTKLQTMIAGRQAPDLFWLSQEYVPAYADNGTLTDLTGRVEDAIDLDDYPPGSLDPATVGGALYGLPWIGQPYVVYYNADRFAEADLAEPDGTWTWTEFREVARALTDGTRYGYATTGTPPVALFAWGEGGDYVTADGEVVVDSDATVAGLELAHAIANDATATMPQGLAQSRGVESAFVDGTVAMMVGGAADDIERKVAESGDPFEVGMAVMPAGSVEHVTFNWTASTVLSATVTDTEAGLAALTDLTHAMFDWKIPAPVSSRVGDIADVNPQKAYAVDVVTRSAEIARGFHNQPQQNELGSVIWEQLEGPILSDGDGRGVGDLADLAAATAAKMREVVDR